jgi:hypothetical protein
VSALGSKGETLMKNKPPKITVKDEKGRKTSIGRGMKDMKFGETRTFNISIDMPAEKPPQKEK